MIKHVHEHIESSGVVFLLRADFIFFILMFLLVGCAPAGKSENVPYSPVHLSALSDFNSELNQIQLSCPSGCPTNVGLVVFKTKNGLGSEGLGQCSGSMIGKNLVLTESRCIPFESQGKSCADFIGFAIHSSSGKTEISACEKIISTEGSIAILQLQRDLTDSPLKIQRTGFSDQQSSVVWTADTTAGLRLNAVLRPRNCISVQRSMIAPEFTHPFAERVSLFGFDCRLGKGSPGAAVLTAAGEISGVIERTSSMPSILVSQTPPQYASATNLACLKLEGSDAPPPECSKLTPSAQPIDDIQSQKSVSNSEQQLINETVQLFPAVKMIVQLKKSNNPSNGSYLSNVVLGNTYRLQLIPECIYPRAVWKKRGIHITEKAVKGKKENFLDIDISEYDAQVAYAFDAFLRPTRFFNKKVVSTHRLNVSLGSEDQQNAVGEFDNKPISLRWCNESDLTERFNILVE